MSVTRGQVSSISQVGSGSSATCAWSTNPTAGESILVFVQSVVTPDSVVDNGSSPTTFTLDVSESTVAGIWVYRANGISLPSSGSYAVTVNITGLHTIQVFGREYIGMQAGPPDATNTGTGTGTAISSGAAAPSNAGGVVFGGFSDDTSLNPETITFTGSAPLVEQIHNDNGSSYWAMGVADGLTGSSQTLTWTIGDSQPWNAVIAAYSPASTAVTGSGDVAVSKATASGTGSNGSAGATPSWDTAGSWTKQFSDEFTSPTLNPVWQPGWFGDSGITPAVNSG